jgi:NADPH:quinone reductase-like Zn-dependent oxidoreductase
LGSGRKVVFFVAKLTREDLLVLKDLLATGKVKPFVERTYRLAQVADAMRYLGTGHAQGKIVVTLG